MSTAAKLYPLVLVLLVVAACHDGSDPIAPDAAITERLREDTASIDGDDEPIIIVDPFRRRLITDFIVEGELLPGQPVSVRVEGIASEKITGGTVRVLMPTVAAMEQAGAGKRPKSPPDGEKFPTVASWTLPAMDEGAHWKGALEVGPFEKGYYQIVALVDATGPDQSPYIIDDGYHQAWMFIVADGGFLTDDFKIDVFPPEVAPMPGPFRQKGQPYGAASKAAAADVQGDSGGDLYARVLYVEDDENAKAVGAQIWANTVSSADPDDDYVIRKEIRTVGSSGIVRFTCPGAGKMLVGASDLPSTADVDGARFNGYWDAYPGECGDTITVTGTESTYLPWIHLDEAARLIEDEFGTNRSRLAWKIDLKREGAAYSPSRDQVTFGLAYNSDWVAAHEFAHALHEEQLGGLWSVGYACTTHRIHLPSGYRCALLEGFADYTANIGAPNSTYTQVLNWETYHRRARNGREEAEIEGNVAAFFHDLFDAASSGESKDKTHYSASYVLTVFRTCRVKARLPDGPYRWEARNDVSDIVWCMENRVHGDVHADNFPGVPALIDQSEGATEPAHWSADDIRSTWRLNVGTP